MAGKTKEKRVCARTPGFFGIFLTRCKNRFRYTLLIIYVEIPSNYKIGVIETPQFWWCGQSADNAKRKGENFLELCAKQKSAGKAGLGGKG